MSVESIFREPASAAVEGETKRVFVVDDHPMVRIGLSRSINRMPNLTVCGEAANAQMALDGILDRKPDLVTMDLSLPDKNGLDLIKDLLCLQPSLLIVVFSMHDERNYAERVIRAGAKAFVTKCAPPETLITAISSVLQGNIYLSDAAAGRIINELTHRSRNRKVGVDSLTDRELEIFELIGLGCSGAEIASRLKISVKTVDAHKTNIKSKLRIAESPGLIRAAVLWLQHAQEQPKKESTSLADP